MDEQEQIQEIKQLEGMSDSGVEEHACFLLPIAVRYKTALQTILQDAWPGTPIYETAAAALEPNGDHDGEV